MKRSRRLSPLRSAEGPILDLTPMIDAVFLLIIFFMVSTTFVTLESGLPVNLPQAQSSQVTATDTPTVTITADNVIYLAGTEVAEGDLLSALHAEIEARGLDNVVLRADETVPHGLAVRVMDIIKQAGAQTISIATGGGD